MFNSVSGEVNGGWQHTKFYKTLNFISLKCFPEMLQSTGQQLCTYFIINPLPSLGVINFLILQVKGENGIILLFNFHIFDYN